MHESVIEIVRSIRTLVKSQYQKYVADVVGNGTISIHDTIKANSLPLFSLPKLKMNSKSAQRLSSQCGNASLLAICI